MDRPDFLTPAFFQNVCDQISKAIGYNINVMDSSGVIIASATRSRIGEYHMGAAKVMSGEVDRFDVDLETACKEDVLEGSNIPLEYDGRRIANIGVTAPLHEAQRYAEVVRICVNAILRDTGRELEMSSKLAELVERRTQELAEEIRKHQQTERELQLSEQRFKDMALSTSDWFWEKDQQGRFSYISGSFVEATGYQPEEVLGKTSDELFLAPDSLTNNTDQLKEILAAQSAGRSFRNLSHEMLAKDGRPIVVEVSGVPIKDTTGEVVGYRGTGTDITRRRVLEEAYQQAEKMAGLGEMVAGVAHEVNTPLGVCVTVISHLQEELQRFEAKYKASKMSRQDLDTLLQENHDGYQILTNNLRRAADLIRSFKQVAVDQGSEQMRPFNMKGYIEEIITSLGPKLHKSPHTFSCECPDDLEINSRPDAFAQIITNFVMNSLIHGFVEKESGQMRLSVALAKDQQTLELIYTDNGAGMSEETRQRIYEPFYTTRRGVGSGLGMHIIFNMVTELLKGTVRCSSRPGKGVRFEIRLPIREGSLTLCSKAD